jgi:hypothetical protein
VKIEQDWSSKLMEKVKGRQMGLCIVQRVITNRLASYFPVKMTKFKLNKPPQQLYVPLDFIDSYLEFFMDSILTISKFYT